MDGYCGRILRINLTRERVLTEGIEEDILKRFVGGYGTAGRILYLETPPWVSPFDPLNTLIFSTGPITGSGVLPSSRFTIVAKSPLTGYFGDSNSGGFFGPEIKFAGYDMITIQGRAKGPTYIVIEEDNVEIKNAEHLWGKDAREVSQIIKKDHENKKMKVATIGQAGENLVRFANITTDDAGRFAGRCGLGAVMGSKKLKAVAVHGNRKVQVADEEGLKSLMKLLLKRLKDYEWPWDLRKYGTAGGFSLAYRMGDIPIHNWSKGTLKNWEKLTTHGEYGKKLVGTRTCYHCPIGCRKVVEVPNTSGSLIKAEGVEYESLASLGANCGITDVETIIKANDLCNVLGLDTISTGSVIAFAMECYEKKILTKNDTGGLDLNFGDIGAEIELIKRIAKRRGLGDLLAEGVRRAAKVLGARKKAIHVKGMEMAMHHPFVEQGIGLTYATALTGARHTEGLPTSPNQKRLKTRGKAEVTIRSQNYVATLNAMEFCSWTKGWCTVDDYIKIYKLVTGYPMSKKEFMKIGERIFNLKRVFNLKHGQSPKEDTLPYRLLYEPLREGATANVVVRLSEMLPEYYELRGWDQKSGLPSDRKLSDLELLDTIEKASY